MPKPKKIWVYSPPKPPAPKVTSSVKAMVQQQADVLVETVLKPQYIQPAPARSSEEFQPNYIVDIYAKWYRHYFYFCAKYCVPSPNALVPFFESKFARLEYLRATRFNLAFMRYTNEWIEIYSDLSLEQCLAAIQKDPFFHP